MQKYSKHLLSGLTDVSEEETNATPSSSEGTVDMVDCYDSTNGLLLLNIVIPEEVVANILTFLPWKELLPCRLVCQTWRDIIDLSVGREKIKTEIRNLVGPENGRNYSTTVFSLGQLPFSDYYAIGTKFGINLLKNPYGNVINNKLEFWGVESSGGDGWEVEEVPIGCNPLPKTLKGKSCFVTSYRWACKHQWIDLIRSGISSKVLDEIQPDINVSEWYTARFDCSSTYKIRVELFDEKHTRMAQFLDEQRIELLQDDEWNQVSHTFSDYGPGLRHILFTHGGCDNQFWQGHYGSKMTGAKVTALLPQRFLKRMSD